MRLSVTIAAAALVSLAVPAFAADDPADMVELADKSAARAPEALQRSGQGRATFVDYDTIQFRGVRANYKRFEIVNDRIVFCGEVNAKMPNGQMSGWTKFAFLPGDPPILVSNTPGMGLVEIGPKVLHNVCETGKENWLAADYTASFQRPLKYNSPYGG